MPTNHESVLTGIAKAAIRVAGLSQHSQSRKVYTQNSGGPILSLYYNISPSEFYNFQSDLLSVENTPLSVFLREGAATFTLTRLESDASVISFLAERNGGHFASTPEGLIDFHCHLTANSLSPYTPRGRNEPATTNHRVLSI